MKKIILKVKLKNRDNFEQMLSDIDMDFGTVYWQHERIYVPREYKDSANFPRLIMRTEMKSVDRPARYEIILKRHIMDSDVDIVDGTIVKDYTEAVNIIRQLGFKEKAEVSKKRQELVMDGGTKIYLDDVEKVAGFYAKIETVLNDGDKIEDVRKDLEVTMSALGEKQIVEKPYFTMLS